MNTCKCGKQFETYAAWEPCKNCNDGEDRETGNRCMACGGFGDYNWDESDMCKDCLRDYYMDNDIEL